MATTPSAYMPSSYAPTNVTNGTSGSTTPESERNAALQATGNTGSNPYSEAILHTQNWLQYKIPPQQPTPPYQSPPTVNLPQDGVNPPPPTSATSESYMPPQPTSGVQGAAATGNGITLAGPQTVQSGGMTASFMPSSTAAPELGQQQNPNTDTDGDGIPDTYVPPGGGEPPPPPPAPPRGGRPVNPADEDAIIADLVTKYGSDAAYWKRARAKAAEWSKTPGFGWLQNNPQVIAAYETDPNKEGTFTEWVSRNWEGLAAKGWVEGTPQYMDVARQKGYDDWARRLSQGDGTKPLPKITGKNTRDYDEWYRMAVANKVPLQDFWTWYGDPSNPKGGAYKGPTKPGMQPGNPLPPGHPNGGAPQTPGTTGGPAAPGGNSAMEDFIRSLRDQGQTGRDAALRQFRHEAGMSGLNDQGAYNPALADLINKSIQNENSSIYEIINAKDEGERNRALQKYLGEIGAQSNVDAAGIGANASMYGADRGLQASKYSDDIRKLLGLTGFDVDRENNWFNNQNNMQDNILRYLQMIMGMSPDQILGGNQVPGGDGF